VPYSVTLPSTNEAIRKASASVHKALCGLYSVLVNPVKYLQVMTALIAPAVGATT
jgi:hypothetical protein